MPLYESASVQVVTIVNAIFNKVIDPADMRSYMMAFAGNMEIAEGLAESQIEEAICQAQIYQWRNQILAKIEEYNRVAIAEQARAYEAQIRQEAYERLHALITTGE